MSATHFLMTILVLLPGHTEVSFERTIEYEYLTELECLTTADLLRPVLDQGQFVVCDRAGPGIPTRQELADTEPE